MPQWLRLCRVYSSTPSYCERLQLTLPRVLLSKNNYEKSSTACRESVLWSSIKLNCSTLYISDWPWLWIRSVYSFVKLRLDELNFYLNPFIDSSSEVKSRLSFPTLLELAARTIRYKRSVCHHHVTFSLLITPSDPSTSCYHLTYTPCDILHYIIILYYIIMAYDCFW